jgi:MoxR-like ATPase
MHPSDLADFLDNLIAHKIDISTMIWGPPGIGKSSIVQQTAQKHKIGFIDLRLSQLAPTDLRGLPVADGKKALSRWLPPEFLPRTGRGVLFLDEINLAPPTMQGMAQQLILDRRVGSYTVPAGWFIWAAGNRKEDRATVFDMPAPLANRFIHLDVKPDLSSFKSYALHTGISDHIVSFVTFRPELLHKMEAQQAAWPSPRSWVMANALYRAGLNVAPAVGNGVATEFSAYIKVFENLPDLQGILDGGMTADFPAEPSMRYAAVIGLAVRAKTADEAYHAYRWLAAKAEPEWLQLCTIDLNRRVRQLKGGRARLGDLIAKDAALSKALEDAMKLAAGGKETVIQTFAMGRSQPVGRN